jgi:hypothetical protein
MASIDAERWLAEHDQIEKPRTATAYHVVPAVNQVAGVVHFFFLEHDDRGRRGE